MAVVSHDVVIYVPVMHAKLCAQELVDIVREQTNAPLHVCIDTISAILSCLLKDMAHYDELYRIKTVLDTEDIVDVDRCFDAVSLDQLTKAITSTICDKREGIQCFANDEVLMSNLEAVTRISETTDDRIIMKQLMNGEFVFIEELVLLYQIERQDEVKIATMKLLLSLCRLDNLNIYYILLQTQLPILIVKNYSFVYPLSNAEIVALDLLIKVFSGSEKPPCDHYEYFNRYFLERMLSLCQENTINALRFLINFNGHLDDEENFVIDLLQTKQSLSFGISLIWELNCERNNGNDLLAIKMIKDIFHAGCELVSKIFYINDLKVLSGILCTEILNTAIDQRTTMILEIFERTISIECDVAVDRIKSSIEVLLLSEEISSCNKYFAEMILESIHNTVLSDFSIINSQV